MNQADVAIQKIEENRGLNRPSKRQSRFIQLWLNPDSSTFGNAYRSALDAGFSESTARVITGDAKGLQWVQDAKRMLVADLEPEHIYQGIQAVALKPNVQERDRLKALELMAKIRGMFIERTQSEVNITFTNTVPRPDIIEA